MPDNKKKKKLDGKRINLSQKHEVDYIKRQAKRLIEYCDKEKKYKKRTMSKIYHIGYCEFQNYSNATYKKLAKALLKLLK